MLSVVVVLFPRFTAGLMPTICGFTRIMVTAIVVTIDKLLLYLVCIYHVASNTETL